jgi:hypothetical protein
MMQDLAYFVVGLPENVLMDNGAEFRARPPREMRSAAMLPDELTPEIEVKPPPPHPQAAGCAT